MPFINISTVMYTVAVLYRDSYLVWERVSSVERLPVLSLLFKVSFTGSYAIYTIKSVARVLQLLWVYIVLMHCTCIFLYMYICIYRDQTNPYRFRYGLISFKS